MRGRRRSPSRPVPNRVLKNGVMVGSAHDDQVGPIDRWAIRGVLGVFLAI